MKALQTLGYWLIGTTPHAWTPWETREVKATGFAATFGRETMKVQSRFCMKCGLVQETGLSTLEDVRCEDAK